MTCKECEKFQEKGNSVYYFRWDIANVGFIGCEKHIGEIFTVLRNHKKEIKK